MSDENKYGTAIGYLNFSVETQKGQKKLTKFGLTLVQENALHVQIAELMSSEEMTNEDLLSLLSVNFVSVAKVDGDEDKLAFVPKAKAKTKVK